jgi:hypothetical protein
MRVILLSLCVFLAPPVLSADLLERERSLRADTGVIPSENLASAGGCDELFAGVSAATVNELTSPGLHAMAQQTPWADLDGNGYPEPLTTQLYNHGGWVFEDRARRLPEIRPAARPEILSSPARALRLTSYAVDLNGDGRVDHVEGQTTGLWVRWGIEGGLGEPVLVIPSAWDDLSQWFVGDFDRDGDLDVLEENILSFRMWANDSRGSFAKGAEFEASSYDRRGRVTVGDFDGDGWLDVFALSLGDYSSRLTFLWGTPAGSFVETSTFETGQFPIEPATVDLDDDGVDEIVGVGKGGVAIIRAGSRKPVSTFSAYRDHPTSTDVQVTVAGAADIDGDGLKDLVIRRGLAMTVFWSARETLKNGEAFDYDSYSFPNAGRLALVDADRDGLADIVPLEPIDRVNFVPGRRDRQLRAPRAQLLNRTAQGVSWNLIASAGDVDGDGLEDLLLGALSNVATILLARGEGFEESYRLTGIGAVEPVRVVDVDGDGWLDLVHRDGDHGMTRVRFGLGNGTFSSGETISGFKLSGVMTSRWGVVAYGHCSEGLCGLRTRPNRSLERFVIARGAEWESAPMPWAFDLTGDGLDGIAYWGLWNWEYAWVFHEIKEDARAIGPIRLEGMLPFHDAVTGERLILGRDLSGLRAYRFIPTGLENAGPLWYGAGLPGVPAKFMREGREDFAVTKTYNSMTRLYTIRNEGHGELFPGPPVDVARSGWGDGFLIHDGESGSPRVLRLSNDIIEIVPLACGDQPFRTSLGLARSTPLQPVTVHIALPLARDQSHFEVTIADSAGTVVFSKWVPEYFSWTTTPLPAGQSRWKISYVDPLLGKQEAWIDLNASSRRRAVRR